ncbi:SUF system Fe-S cluster assembly regulator [Croceicoccus sp. BE223]|uniref:SUF system Fe-S cluster assembly regulator n=1 Tax=Croceicoccus sp. BE223 TaxID=2817716 RepID=UPI00286C7649|nr:SUF system Fe-S cluster assembly regulator [Croceicoccus sp. BE223]
MRLSSMADYAVVAMRAAALHCGGDRTNASEIAEETGLPLPTVQKLVSRLGGAGLLRSVRGAGGGFRLARPAAAITVADIVEAIEGPIALTQCCDEDGDCAIEQRCGTRAHWPQVNRAIRGALEQITLADLAHQAVRPEDMKAQIPA